MFQISLILKIKNLTKNQFLLYVNRIIIRMKLLMKTKGIRIYEKENDVVVVHFTNILKRIKSLSEFIFAIYE